MNLQDPQERTANAGEYVLGTLGAEEKRTMDAALATDTALRGEVYAWQDRLLGLTRRLPPVAVPPGLWPR
ncbi:MAG: RNA polymerase subunit sigma-70, partial [Burkholderiales bacterium]|nr:RNA polymerase subunit sigma-70 [Burkholderiales bacterium]